MKRSEMINILLDEMTNLHGEQMGHDFEVKLANLLLDRIEKEGMMPPIYYPYSCMCSMRGCCPTCDPNEYKQYSRWEPE